MNQIRTSFDEIARKYDQQREQLIPCYHDFYQSIVTLSDLSNPRLSILDLGAGTGLLTSFLINKFPDASFTLVDFADEMLAVARKRFEGLANVGFLVADYKSTDWSGKYDIIASSLSIHHLTDNEKDELYKTIYQSLNPGGLFINGDLYLGRTDCTNDLNQQVWFSRIDSAGLTTAERDAAYFRMTFDKPSTLDRALKSLENTGFSDVDVFYKYFRFAVIRGAKK